MENIGFMFNVSTIVSELVTNIHFAGQQATIIIDAIPMNIGHTKIANCKNE